MNHPKETSGKLLSDEDAEAFGSVFRDYNESKDTPSSVLIAYGQFFVADREARIQRNREGIEKMFAKMCELDTPKRGELHLLLISLFS